VRDEVIILQREVMLARLGETRPPVQVDMGSLYGPDNLIAEMVK
jgi:hypothetical protein